MLHLYVTTLRLVVCVNHILLTPYNIYKFNLIHGTRCQMGNHLKINSCDQIFLAKRV